MTTITKFTKEQLIATAKAEIASRRYRIESGEWGAEAVGFYKRKLAIAEIALASLTAEPVGYFYADKPGDWYQISDGDRVPSHRRIPLYASPQSSPAVKLPNEFVSNEGVVVQIEKLMAVLAVHGIQYERRGNACRAAMLQGSQPVTTPKKLTFEQWLSQQTGTIDVECGCVMTEVFFHWLRVAYEAGNSPVISEGR